MSTILIYNLQFTEFTTIHAVNTKQSKMDTGLPGRNQMWGSDSHIVDSARNRVHLAVPRRVTLRLCCTGNFRRFSLVTWNYTVLLRCILDTMGHLGLVLVVAIMLSVCSVEASPMLQKYLQTACNLSLPLGGSDCQEVASCIASRGAGLPDGVLQAVTQAKGRGWECSFVAEVEKAVSVRGVLVSDPAQIHISCMEKDTEMTVLWTTNQKTSGSTVKWGTSSSNLSYTAEGISWTFSPRAIFEWDGRMHGANMSGLIPGQRYFYQVGDETKSKWSQVHSFVAPDRRAKEIRVAMGGDMGSYQLYGFEVLKQLVADDKIEPFDAFWLAGDIAYSTLSPPDQNFEFWWDVYMGHMESLADHVPFHVSFGNHEYTDPNAHNGDLSRLEYPNRFRNPSPGVEGGLYWYYTHGPVMYISFCTERQLIPQCEYAPGSAQYLWLEALLRNVDRSMTPWVIVSGHRPGYSSDLDTDSGPLLQYLEPLFVNYSVDVVFAGHMHSVEFTYPVRFGIPELSNVIEVNNSTYVFPHPNSPVYLTAGSLGAVMEERFVHPPPPWSLYRDGNVLDMAYGYLAMHATHKTMTFKYLRQVNNENTFQMTLTR